MNNNKLAKYLLIFLCCFTYCKPSKKLYKSEQKENDFIQVKGTQFTLNNKPYYFVGTNFWAGMNLGSLAKSGNRNRLLRELDNMKSFGINNIRIMALTEGPNTEPYRIIPSNNDKGILNENLLIGLDFLLDAMNQRNMKAVVCLTNFWSWSGGMAQYQKWVGDINQIDYPMDTTKAQDWDLYMKNTAKFYSATKAVDLYKMTIEKIINRKNSLNHFQYKNDATIMSWELCNEPRGMNNVKDYLSWIDATAKFIKDLDSNHLVTVGSEGLDEYKNHNGTPFIETHSSKYIDYTCVHLWVQNWNWYNPEKHQETFKQALTKTEEYLSRHIEMAAKLNKPFVLEEFGIGRDSNSYSSNSTTNIRDSFYAFVFEKVYQNTKNGKASGVNFWAWAGEARPRKAGGWWKAGDDFIGDPPHELQGWYSVYNTDTSTLKLIKKYSRFMQQLSF